MSEGTAQYYTHEAFLDWQRARFWPPKDVGSPRFQEQFRSTAAKTSKLAGPLRYELENAQRASNSLRYIMATKGRSVPKQPKEAILVAYWWNDPRDIFLSNILRQMAAAKRDTRPVVVNTLSAVLMGMGAAAAGLLPLYLALQAGFTLIDLGQEIVGPSSRRRLALTGTDVEEWRLSVLTN